LTINIELEKQVAYQLKKGLHIHPFLGESLSEAIVRAWSVERGAWSVEWGAGSGDFESGEQELTSKF
jgi:hypothetical protein